jgi:hypothetical protein
MSNRLSSDELLSRYVHEVSRRLPKKQREDVARELHSLLRETFEAGAAETGRQLSPTAVALILKELGSPAEMARKYSPGQVI